MQSISLNLKEPLIFVLSQFIVFGLYPLFLFFKKIFSYKQLNKENKVLLIFFLTPIIIVTGLYLYFLGLMLIGQQ